MISHYYTVQQSPGDALGVDDVDRYPFDAHGLERAKDEQWELDEADAEASWLIYEVEYGDESVRVALVGPPKLKLQ